MKGKQVDVVLLKIANLFSYLIIIFDSFHLFYLVIHVSHTEKQKHS